MIKHNVFIRTLSAAVFALSSTVAVSAVTVTGTDGVCTTRSGTSHKAAIVFFGKKIRNVISTNNEYQEQGGQPIAGSMTNVTFDVWSGNDGSPGTCIGNVNIQITAGTNEAAQIALEDYLDTPDGGSGVMIRTGSLDARGKIDIYVDLVSGKYHHSKHSSKRQVIWNNFVGMPNASRLMSSMRFGSGEHLAFMYTGPAGTEAHPEIQIFDNAGNFIGVNSDVVVGSNSTFITDNVRSLGYKDLYGNPIDKSDIPADGDSYLKVLGLDDDETEASCMVLYTKAKTNSNKKNAWKNKKLKSATLTYARRNGGNDPLAIGQ
jgi:hypothetical protein